MTAGCRIGDDAKGAFLRWKQELRPGVARVMTMRESRAKGVPPVVLYVTDGKPRYLMVQLWGKLGPFGEYADYYAQFLTMDGGKSFRALNIPAEAATRWPTAKMPQDAPNIPHYCHGRR
jgi:hypothetical protein